MRNEAPRRTLVSEPELSMLWIIGGTSETRILLDALGERVAAVVTVATESGKSALPAGETVIVGRMNAEQMRVFVEQYGISSVADMTHPYAVEVSRNARQVCEACAIPYFRYIRERTDAPNAVCVASVAACAEFLRTVSGCVFFTTGSTHVGDFQRARGERRFVYRVLPTRDSLDACAKQGVEMRDIVAIAGACSEELNAAMFQEYQARYVVMKDSGETGGTPAKLRACAKLGITPVVILRTPEEGMSDLRLLVEHICSVCEAPPTS